MRKVVFVLVLLLFATGIAAAQEPWLEGQVYYLDPEQLVAIKVMPFGGDLWLLLVTVHREDGELERYAGTGIRPAEARELATQLKIPPIGQQVIGGKAWAEYDREGVRLTVVDTMGEGAVSLVLDWEARQAVASMLEAVGG